MFEKIKRSFKMFSDFDEIKYEIHWGHFYKLSGSNTTDTLKRLRDTSILLKKFLKQYEFLSQV